MKVRNALLRATDPVYLYRPSQAYHRARLFLRGDRPSVAETRLPWGLSIRHDPSEIVGQTIWQTGVFELVVSEALWRLLDAGETALDVGANIGYMTSLMAARTGSSGRVLCFEPHPAIYQELRLNVDSWHEHAGISRIELHQLALSDVTGSSVLVMPEGFADNHGTARVATSYELDNASTPGIRIVTRRLDELEGVSCPIGVMKVDVEGHEAEVFEGAASLLKSHSIRDVIFEEHRGYPARSTECLRCHGYFLFHLGQGLLGPVLRSVDDGPLPGTQDRKNYLATLDPRRAIERLDRKGWTVLHPGA